MSFSLLMAVAEGCVSSPWWRVKAVYKSLPLRKTFSVNPVFKDHQFAAMMFPQLSFPILTRVTGAAVNHLLYWQSSGEELLPPAKRTKLEDVTENVNNAYASQDEVKEKSGNLCTLFEKDGNLFRFSSSVLFMEELNKSVLQTTVVFVLQFHFLTCFPGPSKSAV